jgi:predicted ferric reductase
VGSLSVLGVLDTSRISELASDPRLTWYVARATGLVLLVVLTLSTALGILSVTGRTGGRLPRFVRGDLHRRLSLLALALLVAHVVASVLDSYVTITITDTVVPFVGTYRPLWLGLGALSLDLLLVITATSLVRRRLDVRLWRVVHWSAYLAWLLVVLHALGTGSDAKRMPVIALVGGCVALVAGLALWRLIAVQGPVTPAHAGAAVPGRLGRPRLAALVALPLALVLVAGWAVQGPFAPGWAKRAGTPVPNNHGQAGGR